MRTTCRIFLASILLMAVVGIASAQDGSAPPSPAPVPVATPVAAVPPIPGDQAVAPEPVAAVPDLPAIPGTQSDPPAVLPVPASSGTPPLVQPDPLVALPAVNFPAIEKLPDSVVTTKRVTKKAAKKPAEKPATAEADSPEAAGAALSAGAVATTGNTPPPPGAAASKAPAASMALPPAPPAEESAVENPEGIVSKRGMGIGGWTLFAAGAVALFAIITLIRDRRSQSRSRTSIADHGTLTPEQQPASLLNQELKPAAVPRL